MGILFANELSPPSRAVMLACKALGIPYEFRNVDLLAGEHTDPEFLAMNPLHTIPTVKDGDFVLFESHAIVAYLADKSGKDSWYPKDLKQRAVVNQRLHFDNAILFTRMRDMVEPVLFHGATSLDAVKVKRLEDALLQLSKLVQESGWLAGDKPTIADCSAAATVSSILAILPAITVPEKVADWLSKCERELPEYATVNKPGSRSLGEAVRAKLKQ